MANNITCNLKNSIDLRSTNRYGLISPPTLPVSPCKMFVQNLRGVKSTAAASSTVSKKDLVAVETSAPVKERDSVDRVSGKYGKFGGKFVPETLMTGLILLEDEFNEALRDSQFQEDLSKALQDYIGRETPLYHACRLTNYYKEKNGGRGPEIYLKREDLCHGGSHKLNNAVGQAMLAKRLGKRKVVAATGAGQHGVAVAAAAAKLSMKCTIMMGTFDMDRQPSNVVHMKCLGSEVIPVSGSFKDASSEAFRESVRDFNNSYLLVGSSVGPHPYPMMVREFQSVIGKEVRKQCMEKWKGKPDILLACIGGGSNALGLFHEFIQDDDVRLIGVEAGGLGLETSLHSAILTKGTVGVYHGAMSYLLQDHEGQIINPHSIGVGLEYPGVSPELCYLKESMRAKFHAVSDEEVLKACKRLCKLEGIWPALESSHALAYLEELCPSLQNGTKVVVNLSGRGDKEASTTFNRNLIE